MLVGAIKACMHLCLVEGCWAPTTNFWALELDLRESITNICWLFSNANDGFRTLYQIYIDIRYCRGELIFKLDSRFFLRQTWRVCLFLAIDHYRSMVFAIE